MSGAKAAALNFSEVFYSDKKTLLQF